MIYCAPGGRETLAEGLDDLGWRTVKAMVYERVPLQPDSSQVEYLRNAGNLISIWTSISALKLAEEYLPPDVWGKILNSPALVISSRIQHYLTQLGASSVELADGPGNPELLQSVLRLTGQQNCRLKSGAHSFKRCQIVRIWLASYRNRPGKYLQASGWKQNN